MSPLHLQQEQRMIMVFSNVVSWKFACFEIGLASNKEEIGYRESLHFQTPCKTFLCLFGLVVAGDSYLVL
jgi:hypothetical protein